MDDDEKMNHTEQEAQMMENLSKMSIEDQAAFHQLIEWMAYGRPKDDEPMTKKEWSSYSKTLGGKTRSAGLAVLLDRS